MRFANPLDPVEASGFPVKGLQSRGGGSSSSLADHQIRKPEPLPFVELKNCANAIAFLDVQLPDCSLSITGNLRKFGLDTLNFCLQRLILDDFAC